MTRSRGPKQKSRVWHTVPDRGPSLLQFLRNSKSAVLDVEAPRHRALGSLIKDIPPSIGLDYKVELFKDIPFKNRIGKRISIPDFIAFDGRDWTVVEIGASRHARQLNATYRVLYLNWGIRPSLLNVRYTELTFMHRYRNSTIDRRELSREGWVPLITAA